MKIKEKVAKDAFEFLQSQTVGVIGTASPTGDPSVSPVYFAPLPDFTIYFFTTHSTQKFKNLVLNPSASFSVGTGPEHRVVSIQGNAIKIDDKEEGEKVMKLINSQVEKPINTWPIKKIPALKEGGIALFKIKPHRVTFLDLRHKNNPAVHTEHYYQILP